MNDNDFETQAAESEDRRVLAIREFVRAERRMHDAIRDAEKAQKRAAVAQEALGKYRQDLHAALGVDSPSAATSGRTALSDGSEW